MLWLALACSGEPAGADSEVSLADTRTPSRCGWERDDPGTLVGTGAQVGEVLHNLAGTDQCGDEYRLWDAYGSYTLLLAPAFW